jgi:hypothetical protein
MGGDYIVASEYHHELGSLDNFERPASQESRELRQASGGRLVFIVVQ